MHSTCNLEDGYMGSGRRLTASVRKHGVENHKKEILEFFETRELLISAEKKAITPEMIIDENCMNLMGGGTGGFISVEQQRHRSECAGKAHGKRIETDEKYRKIMKDRVSKIMKKNHENGKIKYDTFTNKTHSDETKLLMSETSKGMGIGQTNSQYGTCWITREGLNKKIKKEEINKWINEGWSKGRKI
jgi:hypothetical protein